MKRYFAIPFVLVFLFLFSNDLLAQHSLQLDDGLGNYSIINAPNPGGIYTLPAGGGTLLTTASFGSLLWVTGGNLGSSPNNQLGTLDATDLQFITNGLANIRMTISGTTGFVGIGTSSPGHLLEINGTVDATDTDPFASTNWDLAVNGDIAATGIIKAGAGVTIDGVSNPHEVGADQPLTVYTNNGDLTLATGIPLGGDINLNPENVVNLQAQNPAAETKLHMIMNPNFGGVSWDYGIANSGQLGYIESGFDNFGYYINTDNNPAGGGSFSVNFGADHTGTPLQSFSVDGSGNGNFTGSLTIGNIPALSTSLNILTTNAGAIEQRTAASILGSTSWVLTGNTLSGGTPQTPNEWLGSANDYDLVFKSNNNEVIRITDNGHLTNAPLSNISDVFGQGSASNNFLWEVGGDGYASTISNTDNNPHRNGLLVSIAENTGAARLITAQSGGATKFLVSSDGATSIYGPAILASANSPLNVSGSDGTTGNVLQSNGPGVTPSWVDGSGLFIQNQFTGPQTANFWVSGSGTIAGGAIVGSGLNITGGNLLMGGTSIVDQARNLSNIGNISLAGSIGTATTIDASGIITTAGGLNLNGVNAPLELGGSAGALGQIFTSNGAGATPSWTTLSTVAVTSVIGTANQVLANGTSGSNQTGVVTLTTPQDIAATSDVTFNSATLSSMSVSQPVRTDGANKLISGAINLAGGATEVTGTLPFGNGGTGATSYTANTALIVDPTNTSMISLANGGANTVLHGTTPPSYSAIGTSDLSAGANNTFLTTDGTGTVAWTGLSVGTGLSGDGISTALDANIQHDASLSGIGTTGSNLALNLSNANIWTAQQTFNLANGFKYVDGNEAANKVLLSDGAGQGSWSFIGTSSLSGGANNNMLVWAGGSAVWQNIVIGAGLAGDGVGTALDANIQHDATLTGTGGSASNLGIDLTNANNWTGQQTITHANGFKYVDGNQALGDVLISDATGQASWTPLSGIATIAIIGTSNQVLANGTSGSNQTGVVTLTTPQDIAATSDVTFNSATLSSMSVSQPVRTDGANKLISGAINLAGGATEVTGTLPFGNGGTGATSYTANTALIVDPTNTSMISLANGGANTVLHGTTPPSYSAIGTSDLSAGANNTFLTTDGTGTVAWTGLSVGTGLSGDGITTALTNTGVLSVSGTSNRITSTGGQNPILDIDANYAGQNSITTLGTITSGTWNGTTIDLADGGTGATSYTANTAVIIDPTNTSMISLANGGANTVLHGTTPPSYSAIGAADLSAGANNTFLTTDGTGTVAWTGLSVGTGLSGDGITTALANTGVLSVTGTANRITSSGGQNPVIDIDANYVGQNSITTVGTITTGTWNGTTIAIANGGTGQTTGNGAFNALSPMTTFGDLIYEDATPAAASLAGNITTTKMFLSQTGTGAVSGVPAWSTLSASDVSSGGWALGGNTAPSSNLIGTLDATDFEIVTGAGGPNTRLFISGTTGNIGIGTTTTNAAISFGTLTGSPAIHYYDGGATATYGVGVSQPDAEVQYFIPSGAHLSWNLGGDMQSSGSNELMRLSANDGTLSNTAGNSFNDPLDDNGIAIGTSGLNWQCQGGGPGYAATLSNIDGGNAGANGLLVKIANTSNNALIFAASSGSINSAGTDWFKIFGNGNIEITNLSASMPVLTDASNNLVSAAIDVSTSAVTGVLPIANGGTNSSASLSNGAIMVSSGGAIVEGTSASDPSFTSVTANEAKGAAAGHYAEQHTVAAGEIAGATVTIANGIVAGATSVVVANIVSSANGATSLLTSANNGNVILTFVGGNPAANDVVNYIVVNP